MLNCLEAPRIKISQYMIKCSGFPDFWSYQRVILDTHYCTHAQNISGFVQTSWKSFGGRKMVPKCQKFSKYHDCTVIDVSISWFLLYNIYIYMYVCMYVCIYMHIYIYIIIHIYAYIYIIYIYAYIYICVCVCVCVCVCIYIYIYIGCFTQPTVFIQGKNKSKSLMKIFRLYVCIYMYLYDSM